MVKKSITNIAPPVTITATFAEVYRAKLNDNGRAWDSWRDWYEFLEKLDERAVFTYHDLGPCIRFSDGSFHLLGKKDDAR